uniref:Nuclear receptor binding protein 2 n=1 Tax=Equus asinus TaxID=9793 RepID=A0A9L0I5E4_EQUAS
MGLGLGLRPVAPFKLQPKKAAPEGRAGSTPGPSARPRLPIPGAGLGIQAAAAAPSLASGRRARADAERRRGAAESRGGRRPGPAEPWRPRSRRRGGAGSGSGRTRARTRATSWRRARAAVGRSGGSSLAQVDPFLAGSWTLLAWGPVRVNQGNMPGVQSTFLAMDTEEGVEVVWNELHFADRKAFAAHEEKIQTMFEQLALVDHPNIVKLHKYWLDASEARARVSHRQTGGGVRPPAGGAAVETHPPLAEPRALPPCRSSSSQSTCRRAASSSSSKRPRRTTKP